MSDAHPTPEARSGYPPGTSATTGSGSEFDPGHAGRAYDILAHRYDQLYRENAVLAQSARVSLEIVRKGLQARGFLLELGCGTGRETLEMAALGKRIVACDPSREALRILLEKARDLDLADRIEVRELSASGIAPLESEFGIHAFDGAYSSFALSYEPDLAVVRERVWSLLKPGAPFVCSIYNRSCLMEWILLAPVLVPRRGLSRLEGATFLPVDRMHVKIRSYLPSEVRRLFSPRFSTVGTWGIPALIPPNYLHRLVERSGSFRPSWEALDRRVNGRWPFRSLGSHTAFLFRSQA